jgi:NTP pyrophosphatase (non-canonical NTP hydrolase)
MVNKNICKQYLNHYGTDYTLTVAMEEPAELIHAIAHLRRDGFNPFRKVELAQAIADVEVIIEQLKLIYGIPQEEIDDMIADAQSRAVKRLSDDGRA